MKTNVLIMVVVFLIVWGFNDFAHGIAVLSGWIIGVVIAVWQKEGNIVLFSKIDINGKDEF